MQVKSSLEGWGKEVRMAWRRQEQENGFEIRTIYEDGVMNGVHELLAAGNVERGHVPRSMNAVPGLEQLSV
jgi:hypothetical protein